eukprot:3507485-Amphidinium_carterae.1
MPLATGGANLLSRACAIAATGHCAQKKKDSTRVIACLSLRSEVPSKCQSHVGCAVGLTMQLYVSRALLRLEANSTFITFHDTVKTIGLQWFKVLAIEGDQSNATIQR